MSRQGYELALALENAFQLKQVESLVKGRELLRSALERGEITADEHQSMLEMIELAEAGQWTAAQTEARKLLQDQVDD